MSHGFTESIKVSSRNCQLTRLWAHSMSHLTISKLRWIVVHQRSCINSCTIRTLLVMLQLPRKAPYFGLIRCGRMGFLLPSISLAQTLYIVMHKLIDLQCLGSKASYYFGKKIMKVLFQASGIQPVVKNSYMASTTSNRMMAQYYLKNKGGKSFGLGALSSAMT